MKFKEKQLKIANVVHKTRIGHLRREEREKFIGNFAQAKNLIENQMKVGYHLKMKKKVLTENKKRVDQIKTQKAVEQHALKTKVYGGFQLPAEFVDDD